MLFPPLLYLYPTGLSQIAVAAKQFRIKGQLKECNALNMQSTKTEDFELVVGSWCFSSPPTREEITLSEEDTFHILCMAYFFPTTWGMVGGILNSLFRSLKNLALPLHPLP